MYMYEYQGYGLILTGGVWGIYAEDIQFEVKKMSCKNCPLTGRRDVLTRNPGKIR